MYFHYPIIPEQWYTFSVQIIYHDEKTMNDDLKPICFCFLVFHEQKHELLKGTFFFKYNSKTLYHVHQRNAYNTSALKKDHWTDYVQMIRIHKETWWYGRSSKTCFFAISLFIWKQVLESGISVFSTVWVNQFVSLQNAVAFSASHQLVYRLLPFQNKPCEISKGLQFSTILLPCLRCIFKVLHEVSLKKKDFLYEQRKMCGGFCQVYKITFFEKRIHRTSSNPPPKIGMWLNL